MNATVIINTVNEKESWLRKAIESYLYQDAVDMQVIVSTIKDDPSIELANEYGLDISISPEKGIYQQLNYALQFIKNEWFAYASGNDEALRNKMRKEISLCIESNKQVCYSAFYKCDKNLVIQKQMRFRTYDFAAHLKGNFVNDCATIKTSLLLKYAPFLSQWKNHAYWDLWLRIYKGEGDVFIYNEFPTWKYRITKTSNHVIRSKNSKKQNQNKRLSIKLMKHHDNNFVLPGTIKAEPVK